MPPRPPAGAIQVGVRFCFERSILERAVVRRNRPLMARRDERQCGSISPDRREETAVQDDRDINGRCRELNSRSARDQRASAKADLGKVNQRTFTTKKMKEDNVTPINSMGVCHGKQSKP